MIFASPPKLAYLVLAHADPEQLGRLLSRLDHPADFFVHIDLKSDLEPFFRATASLPVHFVPDRVRIRWGTFSIVLATLRLIRAVLHAGVPYTKLILLSGSCYPAKSSQYLYNAFVANPDHNHIQFLNGCRCPELMRYVLHYWAGYSVIDQRQHTRLLPSLFRRRMRQMIDGVLRCFPRDLAGRFPGLVPCFGGQFFGVSLGCAKYIVDFVDDNHSLRRFWKYTFAPDEHFFHTIIANSPYSDLSDGFASNVCPRQVYRDLASLHLVAPDYRYFELDDFAQIAASDKLFVRKVSSSKSQALLDRIDAELLGATPWGRP